MLGRGSGWVVAEKESKMTRSLTCVKILEFLPHLLSPSLRAVPPLSREGPLVPEPP